MGNGARIAGWRALLQLKLGFGGLPGEDLDNGLRDSPVGNEISFGDLPRVSRSGDKGNVGGVHPRFKLLE